MRATVDERESMRQQLRMDPDTRRRRRKTLIIALLQLPVALLLIQFSLHLQWTLTNQAQIAINETPPAESVPSTLRNLLMAGSGLSLLGISLLLLVRSPFRMPIGERLFRVVWLGPLGRAFLWFSARGVAKRPLGTTIPSTTIPSRAIPSATHAAVHAPSGSGNGVPTPPEGKPGAQADRVGSLEARVAALERWRDEAKR